MKRSSAHSPRALAWAMWMYEFCMSIFGAPRTNASGAPWVVGAIKNAAQEAALLFALYIYYIKLAGAIWTLGGESFAFRNMGLGGLGSGWGLDKKLGRADAGWLPGSSKFWHPACGEWCWAARVPRLAKAARRGAPPNYPSHPRVILRG